MGSGKTTIGKLLATALKREFIDLDQYIEIQENQSISQIFKNIGESSFRSLETKYLKQLSKKQNLILATGGGTPCSNINWAILNSGSCVYLKCSIQSLTDRLLIERSKRPLISSLSTKRALYQYIRSKLKERNSFYERADIILRNSSKSDKTLRILLKHF
jgi:shikimate kinase